MTKDQVKEILDRVPTRPAERQADIAHVIEIMEEQDRSTLCLTDEQAAEVRRRLAERNPKSLTLQGKGSLQIGESFRRYTIS